MSVDLDEYSIYRPFESRGKKILPSEPAFLDEIPPKKENKESFLSGQLASLHEFNSNGRQAWRFDGIISYGDKKAYVQNVPFQTFSIGGYEDEESDTVGSSIWIQSVQGKKSSPKFWYQLKSAASQYKRYHDAFLWIADFAKHVIDYLHWHSNVPLEDFRSRFHKWLQGTHGASGDFQSWQTKYGNTDYRIAVGAHFSFLLDQALQVNQTYGSHPFWAEIDWKHLNAVPVQRSIHSNASKGKTVVTPFVFECFKHMPWGKFLEAQRIAPAVLRKSQAAFEPLKRCEAFRKSESHRKKISIGDVVKVKPHKKTKSKNNDYGYVQDVTDTNKGQELDIIWLYRPSDTACQKMVYPYEKELFLGDNCNCDRGDNHIYAEDVVKVRVNFFGTPDNVGDQVDFFVRQKFLEVEQSWVTLCESDFRCECRRSKSSNFSQYEVGDTLLVAVLPSSNSKRILEPVELEKKMDGQDLIRVRRLQRRGEDYEQEDAEPNELVYTEILETMKAEDIIRRCHIRFFTEEDKQKSRIPDQYRRQGTADFYYIIYQAQSGTSGLTVLSKPWPRSFKQGWDCATAPADLLMKGLDIFCGGGNFGRGLEEGGAVRFQWAVDFNNAAIHTYRANSKEADDVKLFNGSVNDYLIEACQGTDNPLVATPGNVEVISAGSPCQGFSQANPQKGNDKSQKEKSMVSSVVAYVDLYRPKYALLENVITMANCSAKGQDENNFAQVLCALVALGYQVRSFILDAWNFGSPQSRTRLFISIAAPGLTPLEIPPHSHSHPANKENRSLGKSANGSQIGKRRFEETPFEYVTIGAATKDLPLNFEGRIDCIPFPDHRPSRDVATSHRLRISSIPRFPAGMTFVKATKRGLPDEVTLDKAKELGFPAGMTSEEAIAKGLPADTTFVEAGRMPVHLARAFNWTRNGEKSKSWQRANPDALLPTVTATCQPECKDTGSWVHWDACRCLTVMEVRRAQGFPDHEVIVGSPSCQWRIVGNSVARPVAFALGMALRKAWLLNVENPASFVGAAVRRDTSGLFGRISCAPSTEIVRRDGSHLSGSISGAPSIEAVCRDVSYPFGSISRAPSTEVVCRDVSHRFGRIPEVPTSVDFCSDVSYPFGRISEAPTSVDLRTDISIRSDHHGSHGWNERPCHRG